MKRMSALLALAIVLVSSNISMFAACGCGARPTTGANQKPPQNQPIKK